MAFTTELNINGRSYPAAYVKVTVATSSAQQTVLKLQAWETQELREQDVPSLPYPNDLRSNLEHLNAYQTSNSTYR